MQIVTVKIIWKKKSVNKPAMLELQMESLASDIHNPAASVVPVECIEAKDDEEKKMHAKFYNLAHRMFDIVQ